MSLVTKKNIPGSGQIVKGFGDDLGIDGFDPEGIPSTGKIQNTMNPMSSNNIIIPPSGQIMGGGYTPGNNYGDDPGIDEVRPARPGTVSGGKMNKKIVPKSGQIIK